MLNGTWLFIAPLAFLSKVFTQAKQIKGRQNVKVKSNRFASMYIIKD